jgi:hypothetical protein
LIEQKFSICKEILDRIIETEKTPYTQNTHYLSESSSKWLAKYRDMRAKKGTARESSTRKRKISEETSNGSFFAGKPIVLKDGLFNRDVK